MPRTLFGAQALGRLRRRLTAGRARAGFYFLLNSLPNFAFFTCYLTVLFLWMRCYHRVSLTDDVRGDTRSTFRFMFTSINGALYSLLAFLYVLDYFELGPERAFRGVTLETNAEMSIMVSAAPPLRTLQRLTGVASVSTLCCTAC